METPDVTKTETCPCCGRQRVWALWRKCECGYDFGPEVPAEYLQEQESEKQKSREPRRPRVIPHWERSAMLMVSWMALCMFWVLTFDGIFLVLLLWLSFAIERAYTEGFRVGVSWWLRLAAFVAIGLPVLGLVLAIVFDVPHPSKVLADDPPIYRFLSQVFPLTGIPLLVVAAYYFFLIITGRVTQAEANRH